MGFKFLSLNEERGDTSIFLAMILALGVGTTVYYNMDKLNQTLKINKITTQKERAETRNLSGLSQATALMRYSGSNPSSTNPDSFPYIFPDPYLPDGTVVGTPRNSPGSPTWSFANMNLEINSPEESTLRSKEFSDYIFKEGNAARPNLSSKSIIKFTKPVFDKVNSRYIVGYEAEVSSSSFNSQSLVSKATVTVPAPMDPVCNLTAVGGGNEFQPNTPMTLVLTVSGVAVKAHVPETTEALVEPLGSYTSHEEIDISKTASRIGRINTQAYSWTVTTPRPLVAVDGEKPVTFKTYAYLTPVNNNSATAVSCSYTYTVSTPANCKLWTDKATVSPGQCVNLTSGTVGPVRANSLVMSVVDPTGKPVAGLTQTGSSGKFCAPAVSSYSTGVAVADDEAKKFAKALSTLTTDQKKALYGVLGDVQKNLITLFDPKAPDLLNLSIAQYDDLWELGLAQLAALDILDLKTFKGLKTLTTAQEAAFHTLVATDFLPLASMTRLNLATITLLKTLDDKVLDELRDFDSNLLRSYIGSTLDSEAAASAVAVDYKVKGEIMANDGSKNSCIVHVTAGTNQCEFYGSKFPSYKEKQTVTVNYEGRQSAFSFDFAPSNPNWEVEGIATSPTKVELCPQGARCYAIDNGSNRTPFVTVDKADLKTCNATANMRIDLGCFEANTKIRMGDGTEKSIRQLKDKDIVYNPLRKTQVAIKRVTPGPEKLPLWTVLTAEGRVQVTSKHPFMTPEGMKQTEELKAGDLIIGANGEQTIQSVTVAKDAPSEWVWNFELDTDSKDPADHAILADGVVTGDLYLQEQLARNKLKSLTQVKP